MKFKTYLPAFLGFYGSILEDLNDHNEASKIICDAIEEKINEDFKIDIKFEELIRPRFYNSSNDTINIELNISKKELKRLFDTCLCEHKEMFLDYIYERFSSRDGFAPYYSSKGDDWDNYIKNFDTLEIENQNNIVSILLEFWLIEIEEIDDMYLFEYCTSAGIETGNFII